MVDLWSSLDGFMRGLEAYSGIIKMAGAVIAVPAFLLSLLWGRVSLRRMKARDYWWLKIFP